MTVDPYATPKAPVADVDVSAQVAENPHVLWRQVIGLVFWITVLTLAGGPVTLLFGLLLGGLTFADAWVSGIYKRRDRKSFLNISPMSWGILMIALFLVSFPIYVFTRNGLRTRRGTNGFFIATIVLGSVVALIVGGGIFTALWRGV